MVYWIDPGQLGLTLKIHELGHETMITSYKVANKKKLWNLIPNQQVWKLKKESIKKHKTNDLVNHSSPTKSMT